MIDKTNAFWRNVLSSVDLSTRTKSVLLWVVSYFILNKSVVFLGIWVQIQSFGRIFYFTDGYLFPFYVFITLISLFFISSICFFVISYKNSIFRKNIYPLYVILFYLVHGIAMSLLSLAFVEFELTKTGWATPINLWMVIIDLIVIMPIHGYMDINFRKYVNLKVLDKTKVNKMDRNIMD